MRYKTLFFLLTFVWTALSVTGKQRDFVLQSGIPVPIACKSSEEQVVHTALELLRRDLQTVLSATAKVETNTGTILIGTAGRSELIDQSGVDTSVLKGKKQAFLLTVSPEGKLIVAGSDGHGTAYGILEISRLLGVSPWEWWADVTPEKKKLFKLSSKFRSVQSPSVEYRGIFINDEDWGLYRWSKNNYEKERGNFGPKTYAQVCELLLRLQANYLCPAMHDASMAFHRIPENRLVADSFAIVMGSSHCEPLLFNTASEWKRDKMGEWDYINNRAGVDSVLRARANECAPFENVYTLALRGLHDRAMNASNNMSDRKQMLQDALMAKLGMNR